MGLPSLDILNKDNRNRVCETKAVRKKVESGGFKPIWVYMRIYCKSWSCPRCGPIKAWQATKNIAKIAKEKGLERFLTLTLDPRSIPNDTNACEHIKKTWSKFRVYLQRKYKNSISYICVMELHKSGIPHLHVLIDRYIPQKWISKSWQGVGGGKIVFIEKLKEIKDIGKYLAKYLTKNMKENIPGKMRRITTSRDIKLNPWRGMDEGWKMSQIRMDLLEKVWGSRIKEKYYDEEGYIKAMVADFSADQKEETEEVDSEWEDMLKSKVPLTVLEGDEDESCELCKGVEQRSIRERVLDTIPKALADRLRQDVEASFDRGIRGNRKREERRKKVVRKDVEVPEEEQGR